MSNYKFNRIEEFERMEAKSLLIKERKKELEDHERQIAAEWAAHHDPNAEDLTIKMMEETAVRAEERARRHPNRGWEERADFARLVAELAKAVNAL